MLAAKEVGFQSHIATETKCILEAGIDQMRAKRGQEAKETNVLHCCSNSEEEQSQKGKGENRSQKSHW